MVIYKIDVYLNKDDNLWYFNDRFFNIRDEVFVPSTSEILHKAVKDLKIKKKKFRLSFLIKNLKVFNLKELGKVQVKRILMATIIKCLERLVGYVMFFMFITR